MNYCNSTPTAASHVSCSNADNSDAPAISSRLSALPDKSGFLKQELQSSFFETLTQEDCLVQLIEHFDRAYPALALCFSRYCEETATESMPHCSYATLMQALSELDSMLPQITLAAAQRPCQRWKKQLCAEINRRNERYEYFSVHLAQNLQRIRSLNADLYDHVFADVNFDQWLDRVLDSDETSLNEVLIGYHAAIREFYSELALRRLAPLACQMRRTAHQVRRLELMYEYCPIVSLAIVTVMLHYWMIWTWALIAAVFVVSPMMIWVAHPKRCELRRWAAQANLRQRNNLSQDWGDLRDQEAQVLSLLMI